MRRELIVCDLCQRTEDSERSVVTPGFVIIQVIRREGQTQADLCNTCWAKALFGMTAEEKNYKLVPQE